MRIIRKITVKYDNKMLTITEAEQIQKGLSSQIIETDELPDKIKYIGGADVEYDKESDTIVGAIVVLDYETKELLDSASYAMEASFPYIPGLFSFREMPPLLESFKKLRIYPDLIICDAHGIAHPRRFGLACHLGVELGIPTIGCAKSRLVGKYNPVTTDRASISDLLDETTNEIIGKVLRTQKDINPVFVSIGHKISINTACKIVLDMTSDFRLPETTRISDALAREALMNYKKNR